MPNPTIVSENVQRQDGNVRMSSYEFTGDKSVKLLSVSATSPFSVTLLPATGPFRLVPANGNFTFLPGGATVSFGVAYDSAGGTGTTASITTSVPIYSYTAEGATGILLIGPTAPIYFTVKKEETTTKRDLSQLLTVDDNRDQQILQSTVKFDEDSSFGLVRTNPKLTGNVKITVDSSNGVWLNSFDAEKELADDRFKKFKVNTLSSYTIDVKNFFDGGKTPKEIVYSLYEKDNQYTTTKRTLAEQFDKFYQYGATQLNSKYYDEDYSMFAPLYLKQDVPNYFIIFRTEGSTNKFSYDTDNSAWPSKFTEEILSNSRIVKAFDLGPTSGIGIYLRNLASHPARKDSDMTVSFQQSGYTTFNGVSYTDGSFAEKGELLNDFYSQENPLSATEEFLTLGFSRNGILSSHIINLEYLFDDDTAEDYTINRYFGLYVNTNDLAKFELSDVALQQYSVKVGQTPLPRKDVDGSRISEKIFIQNNEDGIRVYGDLSTVQRLPERSPRKLFSTYSNEAIGYTSTFSLNVTGDWTSRESFVVGDSVNFEFSGSTASAIISAIGATETTTLSFTNASFNSIETLNDFILSATSGVKLDFYTEAKYETYRNSIFDSSHIKDQPRLFYLKSRPGDFYDVKDSRFIYVQVADFQDELAVELTLKQQTLDMSTLSGFTDILTQEPVKLLEEKGNSSISFEVTEMFTAGDSIEVRWDSGGTSTAGYPTRWKIIANPAGVSPGEIWPLSSLDTDSEGEFFLTYFHPGDSSIELNVLATSIQNAFRNFPYKNFEVLSKENTVYIKCTQNGRQSESEMLLLNTTLPSIKVLGVEMGITATVPFVGASNRKRVRVKLIKDVAEGMLSNEYVSTKGSFSLTRKYTINETEIGYAPYVEEPVYDESGVLIDFVDCDTHLAIGVENEKQEIQITTDKQFTTYKLYEPVFGVFSVLPLRDFDTDFYSSDYVKSYVPELARYFARFAALKVTSLSGNTISFDKEVNFVGATNVPFLLVSGENPAVLHNEVSQLSFGTGSTSIANLISSIYSNDAPEGERVINGKFVSNSGAWPSFTGAVEKIQIQGGTGASADMLLYSRYGTGASATGLSIVNIGANVVSGTEYTVSFDILATSNPEVYVSVSLGSATGATYNTVGTHTFKLVASGSSQVSVNAGIDTANLGLIYVDNLTIYGPPNLAINVDDTVILMPDNRALFFAEQDLAAFKGFMSLTTAVSDSDEKLFQDYANKWDPTRFLIHLLNSEYDRMAENYLKTLVLKSRVVPYIMKWVSARGKDIRDNPYRFNYHRVFGSMNFSPSRQSSIADARFHTHEWPYLDKVPTEFSTLQFFDSAFSYFFESFDLEKYQLESLMKDWFIEYFTVGYPTECAKNGDDEYESVALSHSERYSTFKFDKYVDKVFTFFRGQMIQINQLDSFTREVVLNSQKYDNYKFSVVMLPSEEDPLINEDTIDYNTYVNEKWKFIVTTIKVKTSSYRNPMGNLGYVDLYTMQSTNDKVVYTYGTASAFGMETFYLARPADKKISSPINFGNLASDPSLVGEFYDVLPNDVANSSDLKEEIVPLESGEFSYILGLYESGAFTLSYFLPKVVTPYTGKILQVFSEPLYYISAFTPAIATSLPFVITPWEDTLLYHSNGGDNSLKGLRDRLSFFEIANVFEKTSVKNKMKYHIYREDGTTSNEADFSINFILPEKLTRVFDYVPVTDKEKPSELFNYPDIGFVVNEIKDLQTLYRYQGEFVPKFRDVLKFWMRESSDFSNISGIDFLLGNTHFGTELSNFSILKNQFYNKVADFEILRISQGSAYQSVYPLVNEISIDKKDFYAWNSSWDQNYYRKYASVSDYSELSGTAEMLETKSMFGSKMMSLPKEFTLSGFQATQVSSSKILANSTEKEFAYYATDTEIVISININERLIREMLGDDTDLKAKKEFYSVMNSISGAFTADTVDSKVLEYIKKNVLPLYEIKTVTFYVLQTGNDSTRPIVETVTVDGVNFTLSTTQLSQKKYVKKTNVKVENPISNTLQLQLTYPFDSRYYTSVSAIVSVQRV